MILSKEIVQIMKDLGIKKEIAEDIVYSVYDIQKE